MAPRTAVLALSAALAGGMPRRVAVLPCPGGRFVVRDAPVIAGDTGPTSGALIISGNYMAVGTDCPNTRVRLTSTRRGTRVAGRWPSCKGLRGGVRFHGTIDSTCTTLSGTLVAPASDFRRAVSAQATASGTLHGRIERFVRVAIPRSERAHVLAGRAQIEVDGLRVVGRGAFVEGPPTPAAGWVVKLGDREAVTDEDGNFTIEAVTAGPAQGQIFHPSDEQRPVGTFYAVELVPDGETPAPISFAIVSHGPCAMNPGSVNDPTHCGAALGTARRRRR